MRKLTVKERYEIWLQQAEHLAKEMQLSIEFRTHLMGSGYMTYEVPVIELLTCDTNEYYESTGTIFIN